MSQGPLSGIRVVEFAGIGPGPFCGMLLSDLGADVIRIDRPGTPPTPPTQLTGRGRRSLALDLKVPASIELVLRLLERADICFEGIRPGVMERLGLDPGAAFARNPKLVYGRMTGWGQIGPLAQAAGHDINYIALSGALHAIGTRDKPVPPLNLVGDFGGGALYLAFGMLAALLHARASGQGQVVDAAMTDGAASLMAQFYGLRARGAMTAERADNLLDGGAPFYDAYCCSDGQWVAIGSLEPQFFALLREKAGLTDALFDQQNDRTRWPEMKARLAEVIAKKTRDEWTALMQGTDVCFAPVLNLDEAPRHPHNVARQTFVSIDGVVQPAPAPRFSRTPGQIQHHPPVEGNGAASALAGWGLSTADIESLSRSRAIP